MTEYWQDLELEGVNAAGERIAKARFAPGSLWFSGHFPGYPVVPGIALLHLVAEGIRRGQGGGGRVAVTSLRRVRFRRPVRPGEEVTVLLSPEGEGAYLFRLLCGDEAVCSGAVRTVRQEHGSGSN